MVKIPHAKVGDKLSQRAMLCTFVGYVSQGKDHAYRFITETGSYVNSANALFHELDIVRNSMKNDINQDKIGTRSVAFAK
jgi:hypothetical protein